MSLKKTQDLFRKTNNRGKENKGRWTVLKELTANARTTVGKTKLLRANYVNCLH